MELLGYVCNTILSNGSFGCSDCCQLKVSILGGGRGYQILHLNLVFYSSNKAPVIDVKKEKKNIAGIPH